MAAVKPSLHGFQLLVQSGVIVTVTGEAAGKPKERLFDYEVDADYPWQDTSNAGDRFVKTNQGVSPTHAIDSACVAAGHNLSGATVKLQSSPDDAIWTDRATLVPSGSGAFRLVGAGLWTIQYSRLLMQSAAAAPLITEVYFTRTWTSPRFIREGAGFQGLVGHAMHLQSRAGHRWGLQQGDPTWQASYLIGDLTLVDRQALEAVYRDSGGAAKPIFLVDADDALRFVWWLDQTLQFTHQPVYVFDIALNFEEAL